MPKMQFRSNAKPSLYAYPEPLKPPKKEEKEKVQFSEEDHNGSFRTVISAVPCLINYKWN